MAETRRVRARRWLTDDVPVRRHEIVGLALLFLLGLLPHGGFRGLVVIVALAMTFGHFRKVEG